MENKNPVNTFDDWIRYASVAIKKGFGSEILSIFKENSIDILMRPYYEACVACQHKDKILSGHCLRSKGDCKGDL
ncbi:MAG: hypothetical protein IPQ18_14610 [Saprospiraceae bacterium]|nr:hypothetical protein [Saprospiraceae bacterium]